MTDFEHPMGGWDMKKMSEALAATMELVAEQALAIEAMQAQLANVALIPPAPVGVYVPRNRRIS